MTGTSQNEARKKQKLEETCEESSLLESLVELDEGECVEPELAPQTQSYLQDLSDIEFGVTDKSLDRDPPYNAAVHELFHDQSNAWVQMANRPTALEMWDALDSGAVDSGAVDFDGRDHNAMYADGMNYEAMYADEYDHYEPDYEPDYGYDYDCDYGYSS
ncbi:hypothetical protein ACQKWADRAFT_87253 [Trichoderma austrokoningii]